MKTVNFEKSMAMQMKTDLINRIESINDLATISKLHSILRGFMKNGINKSYIILEKKEATSPASKSCL